MLKRFDGPSMNSLISVAIPDHRNCNPCREQLPVTTCPGNEGAFGITTCKGFFHGAHGVKRQDLCEILAREEDFVLTSS